MVLLFVPPHSFISLLPSHSLSAHFHFFPRFSFHFLIQYSSHVLSILSLIPQPPLHPLFSLVLLFFCASDSSLLLFLHGQVAEQLAYYVHVSGTVITEEMFDAAVQFGTARHDPTQSRAR